MLLSAFISLLLAKRLHGKAYVLFIAVSLALTSFFSVGLPQNVSIQESTRGWHVQSSTVGILLNIPLPLSFPFYTSLYHERQPFGFRSTETEAYQLRFLTVMFQESCVYSVGIFGGRVLYLSWTHYILYYSFFFFVNVIGAIIGYWIEKKAIIEKLLQKGKPLVMDTRFGRVVVRSAERWATACSWIGFGLILASLLLPWGAHSPTEPFQTGLTSTSDSYLIVGSIAMFIGLLGSLRRASSLSNIFLGVGGLTTIIGAVRWISNYYYDAYYYHPTIFAISVGPFVALIGGIFAILAAVLYAIHARMLTTPSLHS